MRLDFISSSVVLRTVTSLILPNRQGSRTRSRVAWCLWPSFACCTLPSKQNRPFTKPHANSKPQLLKICTCLQTPQISTARPATQMRQAAACPAFTQKRRKHQFSLWEAYISLRSPPTLLSPRPHKFYCSTYLDNPWCRWSSALGGGPAGGVSDVYRALWCGGGWTS